MKLTKIIVMALALSATFSTAATTLYTVNTGLVATSSGIANAAGLQYQGSSVVAFASAGGGVVSFGYFNITDSAITAATTVTQLTSAFQMWNATTTVFASPGATQARGVFASAAVARDIVTSGFTGQNMYVFIGNGASYGASTEFLVLKTGFTFDSTQTGPTAFTNTINTSNSSALLGSQVADVKTTGTDSSVTPGWHTATLVPEPSAALLGALGALGLLRRRRI